MNGMVETFMYAPLGMCMNVYLVCPVWTDGNVSPRAMGVAAPTRQQAADQALAHLRAKGMLSERFLRLIAGFTVEYVGTVGMPLRSMLPEEES